MDVSLKGLIDLKRGAEIPLYRQLYQSLRQAILDAKLLPGSIIPPSRQVASQLNISRKTVVTAIEQLIAEGFLETKPGAGVWVSSWKEDVEQGEKNKVSKKDNKNNPKVKIAKRWEKVFPEIEAIRSNKSLYAFRPGFPDVTLFPKQIWARLLRRASLQQSLEDYSYNFTSGHPRLKAALTDYVRARRLVQATEKQMLVVSSSQSALDLLSRLLIEPGDNVWIEEPGYHGARAAFLSNGANLIPVNVDREGINFASNQDLPIPKLIYVTPSHQYPMGYTLSLSRRYALLEYAKKHGAIIIEDDYDSEFRYEGRPIASLQGLLPNSPVVYIGTFAKTMAPSLRLGYMAVPEALVKPLSFLQRNTGQATSGEIQLAAAHFIEEGYYVAHIKKVQSIYHQRRDLLFSELQSQLPKKLDPFKPDGGMQFVALLKGKQTDQSLSKKLDLAGIRTQPLSSFYIKHPKSKGFLLGYAAWSEHEIVNAVKAMKVVLE